jgi:Phosphodiester glycosidase
VVGSDAYGYAVDQLTFNGPSGGVVTVIRFRVGRVQFALHVGSEDPPSGAAVIPPDAGSAIGPQETPVLLGAFNGGFKVDASAGGFEVDGQVLNPLVAGDASLVIDADGSAHIGVWGQTVPTPGEQVVSVRQNLPPLVTGGAPNPSVGDASAWGAMLGPGPAVPRSGLGQDAAGDILYAGGMSLNPSDLAAGLVYAGAVNAMELDINPEWVQAVGAPSPGGPLASLIPGQNRPADQYQAGWSRDFITVLAHP